MRRKGLLVFAALALVLAGCGDDNAGQLDHDEPAQLRLDIDQLNDSGESGTVTLFFLPGRQTQVTVELDGAPPDTAQPAHIHKGTCDELDPKPAYGLLPIKADRTGVGRSVTRIPVGLEELEAGGYAINIHRSAESPDVYVACGNIPNF